MEVIFMVDIESTGIAPKENDLLQVGILALGKKEDGFWHPLRESLWWCHTDRQPDSEFARQNMTAVYAACNLVPEVPVPVLREDVVRFMSEVLAEYCPTTKDKPVIVGINVTNFDVPFLVEKGVLKAQGIETVNGKDVKVGDYHYQMYEMQGAFKLALDVLRITDRKSLVEKAFALYPELEMPQGKEHEALYDCYRQARTLNGLIRLMQGVLPSESPKNLSNSQS